LGSSSSSTSRLPHVAVSTGTNKTPMEPHCPSGMVQRPSAALAVYSTSVPMAHQSFWHLDIVGWTLAYPVLNPSAKSTGFFAFGWRCLSQAFPGCLSGFSWSPFSLLFVIIPPLDSPSSTSVLGLQTTLESGP
jgi:hypothetical protein